MCVCVGVARLVVGFLSNWSIYTPPFPCSHSPDFFRFFFCVSFYECSGRPTYKSSSSSRGCRPPPHSLIFPTYASSTPDVPFLLLLLFGERGSARLSSRRIWWVTDTMTSNWEQCDRWRPAPNRHLLSICSPFHHTFRSAVHPSGDGCRTEGELVSHFDIFSRHPKRRDLLDCGRGQMLRRRIFLRHTGKFDTEEPADVYAQLVCYELSNVFFSCCGRFVTGPTLCIDRSLAAAAARNPNRMTNELEQQQQVDALAWHFQTAYLITPSPSLDSLSFLSPFCFLPVRFARHPPRAFSWTC